MPVSVRTRFQGAASHFGRRWPTQLLLILAAIVTMYIVLGVLYESYIHPVTILSTLPSAGVGALLALMLAGSDLGIIARHRHHSADRHRQEKRDHDDRLCARCGAQRGQVAARCDLPGVPVALPADPDDDDGGAAGRAAADARRRRRFRIAPSAGYHDGRRPDREPDADVVHHAGDLPRVRPAGAAASKGAVGMQGRRVPHGKRQP